MGGAYLGARPAGKKVLGVCHRLNEFVGKLLPFIRPEAMVYLLNFSWRVDGSLICLENP